MKVGRYPDIGDKAGPQTTLIIVVVVDMDALFVPQKQPDHVQDQVDQPAEVETVGQETLSPGPVHTGTQSVSPEGSRSRFHQGLVVHLPSEQVGGLIQDHEEEPRVDHAPDGEGPAGGRDFGLITSRHVACAVTEGTWRTDRK